MNLFRSSLYLRLAAVAALAVISLAQTGTPLANPEVRRLGDQLKCLCGCGSTVTSCNMLHCHFSDPARAKLLTMVNAGMSDQAIIDAFVKENGTLILMKPPAQGFNLLGWVMPFIALSLGAVFVWWVIRRFRKPVPAVAGGPQIDELELARYRERIERDLEKSD
jgi:cytochrome c-type biogenesis protein CcmH